MKDNFAVKILSQVEGKVIIYEALSRICLAVLNRVVSNINVEKIKAYSKRANKADREAEIDVIGYNKRIKIIKGSFSVLKESLENLGRLIRIVFGKNILYKIKEEKNWEDFIVKSSAIVSDVFYDYSLLVYIVPFKASTLEKEAIFLLA